MWPPAFLTMNCTLKLRGQISPPFPCVFLLRYLDTAMKSNFWVGSRLPPHRPRRLLVTWGAATCELWFFRWSAMEAGKDGPFWSITWTSPALSTPDVRAGGRGEGLNPLACFLLSGVNQSNIAFSSNHTVPTTPVLQHQLNCCLQEAPPHVYLALQHCPSCFPSLWNS